MAERFTPQFDERGLSVGPTILEPGARTPLGPRAAQFVLIPLLVVFALVIVVFYVLFAAIRVEGDSMLPRLVDGDRLLLTKHYDSPQRGDVVVFDALDEQGTRSGLIKRIVAVPGDVVSVSQGIATVNGIEESDDNLVVDRADPLETAEMTVPAGHVFVLGDNRPISLDSRILGPIPVRAIRQKAVYVFAPLGRMGQVE